jgi:hypothetical protein
MAKQKKPSDWLESTDSQTDSAVSPIAQPLPLSKIADWAPAGAKDFITARPRLPIELRNRYIRLLSDERMRSPWAWFVDVCSKDVKPQPYALSPRSFFPAIDTALNFPKKPGDLTKVQREKYFEKVKKHTTALLELLEGTTFSETSQYISKMSVVEFKDATSAAADAAAELKPHGFEDYEHTVTYVVGEETVEKLPPSYPLSSLYDLLVDVIDWTIRDDG